MEGEKSRIQKLLKEGKISSKEATNLLDALEEKPKTKRKETAVNDKKLNPTIMVAGGLLVMFLIVFFYVFNLSNKNKGNLLINSGFEKGADKKVSSWTASIAGSAFWGGSREKDIFSWDDLTSHNGEFSVSINNKDMNKRQLLSWRQSLSTFPEGKKLRLSGYIKTRDVPSDGVAALVLRGLKGLKEETLFATTSMSYDLTGTKDWTKVQTQGIVRGDTEELQVLCQLEGEGTVWCDDLKLSVIK